MIEEPVDALSWVGLLDIARRTLRSAGRDAVLQAMELQSRDADSAVNLGDAAGAARSRKLADALGAALAEGDENSLVAQVEALEPEPDFDIEWWGDWQMLASRSPATYDLEDACLFAAGVAQLRKLSDARFATWVEDSGLSTDPDGDP
jgi:hypothetical protein